MMVLYKVSIRKKDKGWLVYKYKVFPALPTQGTWCSNDYVSTLSWLILGTSMDWLVEPFIYTLDS